jgi:tRNA pseudouridine55 synthase
MDGVLLLDKPSGPTSHAVVMRLRQTSGERGIGHTGTLDPLATGLLVLVFGRATRLAPFLAKGHKNYDATIRLGWATDTDDAQGQPIGEQPSFLPTDGELDQALDFFRGRFEQVPPAHSAKKVAGEKAYDRARRQQHVDLKPVGVTVHRLDRLSRDGDRLALRVEASAGFYVRSLARDLGRRLGCGAHLASLRRIASGSFSVDAALPLEVAERMGASIAARLIAPAEALPGLPAVELTESGLRRAVHGNALGPEHIRVGEGDLAQDTGTPTIRLLGPEGRLLALAERRGGTLHPVVVLG